MKRKWMEIIQGNYNGSGNPCISVLSLILDHMIFQTGNLMVFFPFLSFRNMVLLNSPYPDISPLLALYPSYSPWTPTRNKEMRGWFLAYFISSSLHFFPFYRWENWGSEILIIFPKHKILLQYRAKIWTNIFLILQSTLALLHCPFSLEIMLKY